MTRTVAARTRSNGQAQPSRLLPLSALIAVVGVGLASVDAAAASDGASPGPSAAASGTPFTSGLFGYSMVLPAGWRALPEAQPDQDLFEGPGANARVGTGGPAEPGETAEDRVATNRADMPDCTSDPGQDRATTLGGLDAVAWSWTCDQAHHVGVNAIHDGLRLRLEVSVPIGSESLAAPLLEQLRQSFVFTSDASPADATSADLAAIEAELQGTYQNGWHPFELELATVEAAGLVDRAELADWDWVEGATTVRSAVKFEDGTIVLYIAGDGGPLEVGWVGSYRLLDGSTIEATEISTFNKVTYGFTLRDGILTMDVLSYEPPIDLVPQTGIFETLPFTKVP